MSTQKVKEVQQAIPDGYVKQETFDNLVRTSESLVEDVNTLRELRQNDRDDRYKLEKEVEKLKGEVRTLNTDNSQLRYNLYESQNNVARMRGYVDRIRETEIPKKVKFKEKTVQQMPDAPSQYGTAGMIPLNVDDLQWYQRGVKV